MPRRPTGRPNGRPARDYRTPVPPKTVVKRCPACGAANVVSLLDELYKPLGVAVNVCHQCRKELP